MARMLRAVQPDWCSVCKCKSGPDCPNTRKTVKQMRREERRKWLKELTGD